MGGVVSLVGHQDGTPSNLMLLTCKALRVIPNFGFVDMYGARLRGTGKLTCELTLRDGKTVYDLNGITRPDWDKLPKGYRQTGDARWDAITPAPARVRD